MGKDTAVARTFRILEYFSTVRRPARLKDIVEALGFPTSSTADLLKEMAETGYIAFHTPSRSYFPTPGLTDLGGWIAEATFGRGHALDAARRLNETTGELIFLGTANGLFVQYVEALRSSHPVQYVVQAGVQRLLVRSGLGWALLAMEDDVTVDRIYRRTRASAPGRAEAIPSLPALEALLATVRQQGYAFSRNLLYEGASVIAAAMPPSPFGRRLALGIAGPTSRIDEQYARYVDLLLDEIGRAEAAAA